MALTPRLELRLGQSLVMTPQLQQAIKLLQLNNLELAAYVEGELEQNPLLETDEDQAGAGEGDEAGNPPGEDSAEGSGEGANEGGEMETDPLAAVDFSTDEDRQVPEDGAMDVDYDNLWNNDSPADDYSEGGSEGSGAAVYGDLGSWSGGSGGFDESVSSLEETLSGKISLRDHLTGQLNLELDDQVDRLIGLHLIDLLDEAGYIAGELSQVADVLGCAPERVAATLAKLQQFDPPGIFARDLAECLSLQLREKDRLDPAMGIMLENLDLLARHDFDGLSRLCGVDGEDIADMVTEIRELNPKPALAFDYSVVQPISPDVLMRPQPGGGWIVELNSDTLPRVLVNNRYHARVSSQARSKEDKHYINECFQSANWLVKSLHQRATTILKVATEIVRQQDGFFTKGVQYLKPLVLRDIAEAIEMHESTVSRVTSNKYIVTSRGIYELKYFFTPAIASSSGGEAHSAESVRHRIKALIDAEPPQKVLSDDKLVKFLKGEGIDIARRTVAKYREAMGIASSVQRRREKRNRP